MIITAMPEDVREFVTPDGNHRRQSRAVKPWHGMTEAEFRIHKQEQITNLLIWAALRENEVNQRSQKVKPSTNGQ